MSMAHAVAPRDGLAWPQVTPWFLLIIVANSLLPNALEVAHHVGWLDATQQTFGVSMIVVAATAAGSLLAVRAAPRRVDAWDWSALAGASLLMLVPVAAASLLALVAFALYMGWRDRASPEAVAAASLFAGLGIMQMLIGPLLQLFASRLMALDAFLVAHVLGLIAPGVTHGANLVDVPWGQSLIVDAECASVVPLLQTLLCWLTIARLFRPAWRRADLAVVPFIVLPVLVANVLRMSAMGTSPGNYEIVHGPTGVYAINIICILVAIAAGRWTLAHSPAAHRPAAHDPALAPRR